MAVILAALMFPIGYVYRYIYFEQLAVPEHATSSDWNETLVYAALAIQKGWIYFFPYTAALIGFALLLRSYLKKHSLEPSKPRFVVGTWIVVAAVFTVWFGVSVAQKVAGDDAQAIIKDARRHSTFVLMPSAAPGLQHALDGSFTRIVEVNTGSYFVLSRQSKCAFKDMKTLEIPRKDVQLVITLEEAKC